jgi:SAM-dependent methyltransferase
MSAPAGQQIGLLPASLAALREAVERYYTAKVRLHGATPLGVDWTCVPTQELRFVQLLRVCDFSSAITLNDLGCGYGAVLGLLGRRYRAAQVDYLGIDLSRAMVDEARRRWRARRCAVFCVADRSPRIADYSIASGVFNVRLEQPLALWERFVEETLRQLAATSRRGFAVNFLGPLPPEIEGRPQLYRTEPKRWAAFCEGALGMRVDLLDAYGMREFTLLVRN